MRLAASRLSVDKTCRFATLKYRSHQGICRAQVDFFVGRFWIENFIKNELMFLNVFRQVNFGPNKSWNIIESSLNKAYLGSLTTIQRLLTTSAISRSFRWSSLLLRGRFRTQTLMRSPMAAGGSPWKESFRERPSELRLLRLEARPALVGRP